MSTSVVRLYHGTNAWSARRIAEEGFRAIHPHQVASAVAERFGVPWDAIKDEELQFAPTAWRFGDVSFSTGWGLAAKFARQGGETTWYALRAVARYVLGTKVDIAEVTAWVAEQDVEPAVMTVEATVGDIVARAAPGRDIAPEELLPAPPDSIAARFGIADEVRLQAPIPAEWVAMIDRLKPCTCSGIAASARCAICPRTIL